MKDVFGELVIAIFLLVFSALVLHSGIETSDMVNNWVEGEGLVLSSVEVHDSDDEGNTYTHWICDIAYTKEDGSEWVKENVSCPHPTHEGNYVDILYDPDPNADGMEYGDRPDRSEIGSAYTVGGVIATISGVLFLHLGFLFVKEKIEERKSARQKEARLNRMREERERQNPSA